MPDITGKSLVVYIGDGGGPEVFSKIGATRTDSVTINNSVVERNTKDSSGWSEVFPAGTIKSATISVSGEFNDTAPQQRLRQVAESLTPACNMAYRDGTGEELIGEWQIESFELSGETEGFATFSMTARNNGVITRQAAP